MPSRRRVSALLLAAASAAGVASLAQGAVTSSWALRTIAVPIAPRTHAQVVVAVVDSGIAPVPSLAAALTPGWDIYSGGDGISDPYGHGTGVAGLIAAGSTRRLGVAPNVKLMPVRVVDEQGRSDVDKLAAGIRWAVDHGARVINVSLASSVPWPSLDAATEYAWSHNAVVVAAAEQEPGGLSWPAAYPHVLAVGAINRHRHVLSFSGRGRELDLVSPGRDVPTTLARGGYGVETGTSYAAPLVSGAAALLLACRPELTNQDVVLRLVGSARDLGPRGFDPSYGAGLLDVSRAVRGIC